MSFVLDASVALGWCFSDEEEHPVAAAARSRMRGSAARVPPLWLLEVANALLVAERRDRLARGAARTLFEDLLLLPIEVQSSKGEQAEEALRVLDLASNHSLSTYDACYLDLALEQRLGLATVDGPLQEAASSAGVELVGVST